MPSSRRPWRVIIADAVVVAPGGHCGAAAAVGARATGVPGMVTNGGAGDQCNPADTRRL